MKRMRRTCLVALAVLFCAPFAVAAGLPDAPGPRRTPSQGQMKAQQQRMEALRKSAMDCIIREDYENAIAEYQKILELNPNDTTALYNTACAHLHLKNKAKGLEYLKKAVEAGYVNFDQMERDKDLNDIRDEEAYKELIRNKAEYIRKATEKAGTGIAQMLAKQGIDVRRYKEVVDLERNFVYLHGKTDAEFAAIRKDLETYADYQRKHLFQSKPRGRPLCIVMLRPDDAMRFFPQQRGAGGTFNGAANALLCGSNPAVEMQKDSSIIIHEFTHALEMADTIPRVQQQLEAMQQDKETYTKASLERVQVHPIWFLEGLATLFETSRREKDSVVPYHSYRLNIVQDAARAGRTIPWKTIIKMDQGQFMKDALLAYAQSRYMCYYIHEKGLLSKFYAAYVDKANYASDKSALEAFEAVFGKPIDEVESDWKQWLMKQSNQQ